MLSVGLVAVAGLFVAPAMVYADAKRVRALDLDWRPGPVRHAVAAFALTVVAGVGVELGRAPVVLVTEPVRSAYYGLTAGPPEFHAFYLTMGVPLGALYYLSRRYEHLDGPTPSRYWWLAPPVVVAASVGYLAAELVVAGSLPRVAAAAVVLASLFPVGAYLDARHLRQSAADWNPNPAVQFLLAYLAIVVYPLSVLYPAYAAVYLARRRAARS